MKFIGDYKIVEGVTLTTNRVSSALAGLPQCQEREDLFLIAQMLINEGFDPEDFWVVEYPTDKTYVIERKGDKAGVDYFTIYNDNGKLVPQYTTVKMIDNVNQFDCETIREAIKLTEC